MSRVVVVCTFPQNTTLRPVKTLTTDVRHSGERGGAWTYLDTPDSCNFPAARDFDLAEAGEVLGLGAPH